jgi:hypothetical protein
MANSHSSQRPDLQDLVAYLQGRGDAAMRAQVLQRLDEDESYLELMVDLVPMLRAEGEIADPDAAAPPVLPAAPALPAPLPFVAPLPTNAAPSRFRRWPAFAALAALVPITVGLWLVNPFQEKILARRLAEMNDGAKLPEGEADPLYIDAKRGPPVSREVSPEDAQDSFYAGARLFDLHLVVERHQVEESKARLDELQKSLAEDYRFEFDNVRALLEAKRVDWSEVERTIEEDYKLCFDNPKQKLQRRSFEQGSCVRAAWLALKAQNPGYLALEEVRDGCEEVVGRELWSADEKQLRLMLEDQSTEVTEEPRREM